MAIFLVILLLPITHDVFALQGEKYSATLTNGIWENQSKQTSSDSI